MNLILTAHDFVDALRSEVGNELKRGPDSEPGLYGIQIMITVNDDLETANCVIRATRDQFQSEIELSWNYMDREPLQGQFVYDCRNAEYASEKKSAAPVRALSRRELLFISDRLKIQKRIEKRLGFEW